MRAILLTFGVVVGAAAGVVGSSLLISWLRGDFSPITRVSRELLDQKYPELRDHLKAKEAEGANIESTTQALAARGLSRLSDERIVDRAVLMSGLLANLSESDCAQIARGPADGKVLQRALDGMSEDDLRRFVDFGFEAAAMELREEAPRFVMEHEVAWALRRLTDDMDDEEKNRLLRTLGGIAGASEEDACWAARRIYDEVAGMEDGRARTVLARALASSN